MKKLFVTLAIMLSMVFTGMQSSFAQATLHVTWDNPSPPQDCDCPLPGNSYWSVWVAVYDECDQPYETVYEDSKLVSGTEEETYFQLDEFCHGFTQDCYFVVASIDKLCPDGQGGFVKTCCGKFTGEWYTCQYLMNSQNEVPCSIAWCP